MAQGDAELGLSHPLSTVTGGSNDEKFAAIAKLVQEWQPRYFVVGLPVHTDGTKHEMTHLSRKFGRRLNGQLERELADNAWLTVPADEHILFDIPYEHRYAAAFAKLGIDPLALFSGAGHA